jgi:hypothetical protein
MFAAPVICKAGAVRTRRLPPVIYQENCQADNLGNFVDDLIGEKEAADSLPKQRKTLLRQ